MFGHFYRLIDIHIMRYKIVSNKNAGNESVHNKRCSNSTSRANFTISIYNPLSRVRMCPPKPGFLSLFPGHSLFAIKMCLFIKTQAHKYVNDKINTVKSMGYKRCHIISIM